LKPRRICDPSTFYGHFPKPWDMLEAQMVTMLPLDHQDASRMRELMEKYRDVPMDMADAAFVRVAERDGLSRIFTFDGHFQIYRLPRRARFAVLPA
jgi:predicted nucleic acid-binding protein